MISRRGLLVLGGGMLAAGCTSGSPTSVGSVHTRWSSRPDGALPPAGDEGLPLTVALAATTVAPAIESGGLRCALPEQHSAAYVMQTLPNRVQRIGAVLGFGPGSAQGALALVAWVPGTLTSHCHVAVTPTQWIASVAVDGGRLDELGRGPLAPWPQDGSPRRLEVTFEGPIGTLELPDGSLGVVEDPRLATIPGSRPTWEFYRNGPGGAPVILYETWAG